MDRGEYRMLSDDTDPMKTVEKRRHLARSLTSLVSMRFSSSESVSESELCHLKTGCDIRFVHEI